MNPGESKQSRGGSKQPFRHESDFFSEHAILLLMGPFGDLEGGFPYLSAKKSFDWQWLASVFQLDIPSLDSNLETSRNLGANSKQDILVHNIPVPGNMTAASLCSCADRR